MIADEPGDEEVWAAAEPAPLPLRRRRLERLTRLRAERRRPPRRDHRHGRARRRARHRRRRRVRGAGRGSPSGAGASQPDQADACTHRAVPRPPPRASQFPTIEDETDAPHVTATPRVTPSGDDLTTRIITGAVLAAVAILAFFIGRAGTAVLVTVIVAAAAFELFEGFRRAGFQPATLLALLGSLSMVGIAYNHGERAFPLVTAVVVAFTLFWYLAKVVHARPMVNAAVTIFGFSYVGLLGGFAGLLLVFPDGVGMIVGLVLCAVSYDVAGYFVGIAHGPPAADARRVAQQDARGPRRWHGRVGRDGHHHRHRRAPPVERSRARPAARHRGRGVRTARRPGRVDAQARPRAQGLRHHPARDTAGCSTGSTPCCSACLRSTTWWSRWASLDGSARS